MFGTECKSQSLEKALFDLNLNTYQKKWLKCRFFFIAIFTAKVREFFEGNTCYTVDIKEV